jgi:uncharacterized damage-inducible protein DinB
MRSLLFLVSLSLMQAQAPKAPPTLKSILLEQLRTSHNKEDWFVPVNIAIEGLTPEQAKWKPAGKDNHSIGQLANHILYWDERNLAKFKGQAPAKYDGNNDETFNDFDSKSWNETVRKLDAVMTEWERAVEAADEAKLKDWYSIIAHVGMHNAYHTGQILYVRKMQGVWDPAKGVK